MTKTKRDVLKRCIAQAHNNVMRAGSDLATLQEAFQEQHPDMAESLTIMLKTLAMVLTGIDAFCVQAWGHAPSDYDSWRDSKSPSGEERLDYSLCQGYPDKCEHCQYANLCNSDEKPGPE